MVTQWGMSKAIGNMYLGGDKEVFLGRDYGTTHSYSDDLGGIIDNEIKSILDSCYDRAIEILQANREIMDNMVKVLFEKETIYTEEVNMLFDGKSAEEVIAYIDERQAKKESYKRTEPAPKVVIVEEKTEIDSNAANQSQQESESVEEIKSDDTADTSQDEKSPDDSTDKKE